MSAKELDMSEKDDAVLKIHSSQWDEHEHQLVIRVSLLESEDIDEIVVGNEGIYYYEYDGAQSNLPSFAEAPNLLNWHVSPIYGFEIFLFREVLTSLIYAVLYDRLRFQKSDSHAMKQAIARLFEVLSRLRIRATTLGTCNDDKLDYMTHRFYLEGLAK